MYEPKPDEPGNGAPGKCKCKPWDITLPGENEPFRRLLLALEKALQDLSAEPSDATKKFADDLKDAEKENGGIAAVVTKYKEFYDKLDCKLADAKRWKAEIEEWSKGVDAGARQAIETFWQSNYVDVELGICCDWIRLRYQLNGLLDCLEQAKKTEEERQQDYDAIKGFQDMLTKVFTELESLYKQAKAFNTEQKPKSVYAVSLEYGEVYKRLGWPRDWNDVKNLCPKPTENGGYGDTEQPPPPEGGDYAQQPPTTPPGGGAYTQQPPTTPPGGVEYPQQPPTTPPPGGGEYVQPEQPPEEPPEGGGYGQQGPDLKAELHPDKFKKRLATYLRQLILAKYQRVRWHHEVLTKTSKTADGKKACEKFRADRQQQFIEEADDVETPPPGSGNDGGTGYQPPTGGYPEKPPTGGYPEKPPTGGYPEKPPTGGYPEKPPPTGGYPETPPTGGYPPEKPPAGGYPDTPVQQPQTYPGRQKK